VEPVGAAVGWLLGRLRDDAQAGAWSALRGLTADDPLTIALEKVTENALRTAVLSAPGGNALVSDDVDHVVAVLGGLWPAAEVHDAPGDSLLARLARITADAMACGTQPVEGLGVEFDATSPLSALERDYGLELHSKEFAVDLAAVWQRAVRDAAIRTPALAPLAAELREELGHELVNASREDVVAALCSGLDGVTRQLDDVLERLPEAGPSPVSEAVVLPQFVGVADRNPMFVGRADELAVLDEEVVEGANVVLTQVAAGLGGVGKTALAAEFCYRRREVTDVVRWLHAENRKVLVTGYVGMAPALGLNLSGLGLDDAVARVRDWFETTEQSWLLVFDNVEAPSVLDGLVPQTGRGRVLVTSRYRDWTGTGLNVLRVGVLSVDEAVALLTGLTGRARDAEAEALVEWLGGLALAVEQAAAFCRQTGWSFGPYLQHLERRAEEILARNPAALRRLPGGNGRDLTVLTVWDSSLERAAAEADGALKMLDVLAYLGPDHIPHALLTSPAATDEDLLHSGDPLYVDMALAALARYSLVELHREPGGGTVASISVHRLVQEVTRLSHDDDKGRRMCAVVVRILKRNFPIDATDHEMWPVCRLLEPHVTAVIRHMGVTGLEERAASFLLVRYATYLRCARSPVAAPAYAELAVQLHKRAAPTERRTLLALQSNLAQSYQMTGRTAEAIVLYEQVLAETELLGEDHSDVLTTRGNLALAYLSTGRASEARDLQKQVLAESQRILGDDHPETVRARNNLAGAYLTAGRPTEAIPLQEKVMADWQSILGEKHPETLIARSNLAHSYALAGRIAEAIDLQEQVVADRERILGNDHPDTVRAHNNLAYSYMLTGRAAEAILLQEKVVADWQHMLGADHPDTLNARRILANSYASEGRVREAIALLERDLAVRELTLGKDHPDAVATRRVLERWRGAG
jgi:tetratricopeptide (TPR) repeat protein